MAQSARWAIVSNVAEFRLYSKDRTNKHVYRVGLADLEDPDRFAEFYAVLHADSLLGTGALALTVLTVGGVYLLLRGRLGLALTAVRDNEIGARSAGVRVARAQRIVYLLAALGCGGAGALLIISQLNVEPLSAFTVQWSAEMIFVTIIGGIGTIEGPIVGTIVFFVLQQTLSQYGAWYLIILGSLAVVIAIWVPRGLWGLVADRLNIRLFPVGYWRLPERAAPGGATASRPPLEPVTTATAKPDT